MSRWLLWRPSCILDQNHYNNSESLCRSDISHQVSAQSNLRFGNRYRLKDGGQLGYRNGTILSILKKVREKSRECHNHKPQPFPDPKRKRKPTNLNKHKPNKYTKSTKISSFFPKRGNRNTKRTEKHKNKMTHGKTYYKLPRRINHKATKSKTNTGTTALERSVEQTTGGSKALLQLANFTLGPDATLNTEIHKNSVRIKAPNSVNASKRNIKIKLMTIINKDEYSWLILNLYVALMLPIKFQLSSTYGLVEMLFEEFLKLAAMAAMLDIGTKRF